MAYRRLNLGYVSGAQLAARARASGLLAARTREGAWARGALKFPIEALTHALTHVRRGITIIVRPQSPRQRADLHKPHREAVRGLAALAAPC